VLPLLLVLSLTPPPRHLATDTHAEPYQAPTPCLPSLTAHPRRPQVSRISDVRYPPRRSMDALSISELEAHIAALERDLARRERGKAALTRQPTADLRQAIAAAKVARNKHMPLGRLPADVLIPIAAHIVAATVRAFEAGGSKPALLALTAVCAHVRTVLLDAPELWTCIDCSWKEPLVDACVSRAGARPLHVCSGVRCLSETPAGRKLTTLGARASSLSVLSLSPEPWRWHILRRLPAIDLPLVVSITIADASQPGWSQMVSVDSQALSSAVHARLLHLTLRDVRVDTFTSLPALQRADLHSVGMPAEALAAFFAAAPQLVELSIVAVRLRLYTRSVPAPTASFLLPCLRRLHVEGETWDVCVVLNKLCPPRERLHVVADGRARPFDMGYDPACALHALPACVASFCGARAPTCGFRVDCRDPEPCATLELASAQPALHVLQYAIPLDSPLLVHVRTAVFTGPYFSTALFADTAALPHAEHLVFRGASFGTSAPADRARVQPLEAWLAARPPLRALEFVGCSKGVKALYTRLSSGHAAEEVVWRK
jgi:hypothetical protein